MPDSMRKQYILDLMRFTLEGQWRTGQEQQDVALRLCQVDLHDGDERRVHVVALRRLGVQHLQFAAWVSLTLVRTRGRFAAPRSGSAASLQMSTALPQVSHTFQSRYSRYVYMTGSQGGAGSVPRRGRCGRGW